MRVFSLWRGVIDLNPRPPTMADLLAQAASDGQITLDEIRGPSQHRIHSRPRQAFYHAALAAGFSTTQAARFVGRTDHTTALTGARRHAARCAE